MHSCRHLTMQRSRMESSPSRRCPVLPFAAAFFDAIVCTVVPWTSGRYALKFSVTAVARRNGPFNEARPAGPYMLAAILLVLPARRAVRTDPHGGAAWRVYRRR